ncbi:UPF0280 family protein [Methanobacterium sp.]|uniref:UPF0280 family protein n=1 Tax=Methanobacterium sp. TaxID=2164 RepID=UPI003C759173
MTVNRIIEKHIKIEETDLIVKTDQLEQELPKFIVKQRLRLKNYINVHPEFLTSFDPVMVGGEDNESTYAGKSILHDPPLIVKLMARAGRKGDVGPMAAVAGTISQLCMGFLVENGSKYVIIDNGGDIALKTDKDVVVGLYAGESSLSGQLGFRIKSGKTPMGVCTSSGTVGHSISFGRSDSVTVFADEASIADALATSIANYALGETDHDAVQNSIERAEDFKNIMKGVLVVVGENAGTLGKIPKLVQTDRKVVLGDLFDV